MFIECSVVREVGVLAGPAPGGRERPATSGREEQTRHDVVQYARQYEGKPYRAAGKKPSTGFDCSGFTSYVMSNFKVALSASARDQVRQGREKPVSQARPGDLVFFRRGASEPVFHVALVVSNNGRNLRVIHSTTSRGVVVDDILHSAYWKPKIYAVRDVLTR
jgi:cell wall-associated NlpC family hydrolase